MFILQKSLLPLIIIILVSIALHCVPRQINCHAHAAVMNQPWLMQRFDKKDIATKTLPFWVNDPSVTAYSSLYRLFWSSKFNGLFPMIVLSQPWNIEIEIKINSLWMNTVLWSMNFLNSLNFKLSNRLRKWHRKYHPSWCKCAQHHIT